jgi:Zn-finger nucleic acid-binding protein
MQCPVDGTTLQMSERAGIEIDYCPQCRGVWLDRGELDKIIAKSELQAAPAARPAPAPSPGPDPRSGYPQQPPSAYPSGGYQQYPHYPSSPDSPDHRGGYGQGYDPRHGRKRRKESFLGDLFDFGAVSVGGRFGASPR